MRRADVSGGLAGANWPLVGRTAELEVCLDALAGPQSRSIVVHGSAGVGKSRLVDELATRLANDGRRVLRARGNPGGAVMPLGALVHLLPRRLLDRAMDGVSLYAAAVDALHDADRDDVPVLVVDDLQWLDPSSAVLIGQLLDGQQLVVVGTVRSGEPVTDAVAVLWQRGDAVRIDLADLTASDVDSVLHLALGGPVHRGVTDAVWAVSVGNPLFVRELVLGARAAGELVERRGVWWLTGSLSATSRLAELVEQRLRALDPAARRVVELLAVWEPVGLDELEAVCGVAPVELLDRTEMIELRPDGRRQLVTLAHPLYGEIVRSGLSTLSRRRLLLEHAARIEAHGARRRDDALRIAMARLEATGVADADLLVGAARIARHGHDHELVARLTVAALEHGWLPEAVLLRAEALHELGRYDEVEELLVAAPRSVLDDPDMGVRVVSMRVRNLMWGLHRPEEALHVNRLERARGRDTESVDELVTDEALTLLYSSRPRAALDSLGQLSAAPSARVRVLRAIAEIPALIVTGRCEQAVAASQHAYVEHRALANQSAIAHHGVHTVYRMQALTEAGRLDEARAIAERGYRRASTGGPPLGRDWFAIGLGRIALLQGRARTARRWLSEAAVLSSSPGFDGPHRLELSLLAVAESWLGDAAGAERTADEVRAMRPSVFLVAEQDLGTAWSAVANGDPQRGRDVLTAAAEHAAMTGFLTSEAWLLHDLVRLGDAVRVTGRLRELADRCEGDVVAAYAAHADALAQRDPTALDDSSRRFEAMGMDLLAAEAATEAAAAHRRQLGQRAAAASTARAAALAARCEGVRTPGLVSADVVVPLTDREREIGLMAARGLTSRDIADRLYLSPRTVENHLQRVYTKLGITNRAELGPALTSSPDRD